MKTGVFVVIILIVVILGAIFLLNRGQEEVVEGELEETETIPAGEKTDVGQKENVVEITSSGFNPSTINIKKGEMIKFVNKDSSEHWPASAFHPTHKIYPGSGIEKCGTEEESEIFDVCKGLRKDESYSFTFNNRGSWNYHDHLNPSSKGVVVVS